MRFVVAVAIGWSRLVDAILHNLSFGEGIVALRCRTGMRRMPTGSNSEIMYKLTLIQSILDL